MEISNEIILGELLRQQGYKLAVAESCTGGLISHRITNIPGSSIYFMGGTITYSDQAKADILGVKIDTLQKYGAVSEETAIEMAQGVRKVLRADIGLSITGIAGPGGGTYEKPIGLTWIGLCMFQVTHAWCFIWNGNRLENKEASADQALKILINALRDEA